MYNMEPLDYYSIKDLEDVSKLCLVCLTEGKSMKPLDTNVEFAKASNSVLDCLQSLTNIKINTDPNYPHLICRMCLSLLKISYDFNTRLNTSQKIFATRNGNFVEVKKNLPSVEIISTVGTFDLNDVVVIEDEDCTPSNYEGFLKNLGAEVSAVFVGESFPSRNEQSSSTNVDEESISATFCPVVITPSLDEIMPSTKQKIFPCSICKKIFQARRNLTRHINDTHYAKNKMDIVCELCGLHLKTRSQHYHHMVRHNDPKHRCEICGKGYFGASHLRQHINAVHVNHRTYLCTVCGKSFNYSNALTYHMRLHTGERNYECVYCERKFTMYCGLKRHLVSHTGVRNYPCSFCKKLFKSRSESLSHEMIHTGVRPYHCKYCQKGFIKSHNMKVHIMNHEGPHHCYMCERTFVEMEILKFHMKKVHGIR